MFHTDIPAIIGMAAGFQYIIEPFQIRTDIDIRICDAVTDARLRRQIDHNLRFIDLKQNIDHRLVRDVSLNECPGRFRMIRR